MIPNIIEATQIFLNAHGLNQRVIEQRPVTLGEGNKSTVQITFSEHIGFSSREKEIPITIQIMTIFSMLDTHIDLVYPHLQGVNFLRRYKALPVNSDKEIIFKEIYRIFRKLRNTVIHNSSTINIIGNEKVDFDGLSIDIDTMYWLYSAACELFSCDNKKYYSPIYHECVLRAYYRKILEKLRGLSYRDDIENSLLDISTNVSVLVTVRYPVVNPKYVIDEMKIRIAKYDCGDEHYRADYYITHEGDAYWVPDEAIDVNGELSLSELAYWRLESL